MAQKFYTNVENSKTNWGSTYNDDAHYPGQEKIVEGCMQRIANATEAMAHNYTQLLNQVEFLKKGIKWRDERIEKQGNVIRGLKGRITFLSNKRERK